ncbi:MAG: FAD-binding oxidoreductase [Clostridium sp.]
MIKIDFNGLSGDVVTKDDFRYEEERKCWNRAIEKYPLVIVFCHNKSDVINAIAWSRLNSLSIRIRSGRHHYEGYSIGNDVVVIDISRMNNIAINEDKKIVRIQGGTRNRELYEVLNGMGYPFSGGGCPTVGVVGFTLGGGWGYSSRLFGLGCDNLVEVELIDYKGDTIIANENFNEDLFWACRGSGGGNFGVVTSMTFAIPEKREIATLINMDCPHLDIEEIIKLVLTYQNEFKTLDRRANFKLSIYNSNERGLGAKLTGLVYGSKDEANNIIVPLKSVVTKMKLDMECMSVLEANREIQDSHPDYESYKSGGRFVYNDLDQSDIKKLIGLIRERAEGSIYTAITLYGLGGAISDKQKDSTSFYYRDAKFIMGFQSVWDDSRFATKNIMWTKDKFNHIKLMTEGSFINFPIDGYEDYEKEYCGENILKLRKVKGKYDPENIFNFSQSIKSE